jgi:hypothetical protein
VKLSTRELVTIAVFGTLWGIVEMSLGTVLKSLNIPISGILLAAIGLTVALIGRIFVPQRGSTLFIGVIATLLKLFSLGGVVIGPMVGIITEALIAEIVLSLSGKPRRVSFIIAGGFGVLWVFIQPLITNPLLFGRAIVLVWLDIISRGSRLLGLDDQAVVWIIICMVAIHLAIGATSGWLSWDIGCQLEKRVGKHSISDFHSSGE